MSFERALTNCARGGRPIGLGLAGACLCAAIVLAQQPYRATADLVTVYATVTDPTGRLVPDLTQDQFTVRDNGKSQPIVLFSNDVQPITIVVMLDRSGSMTEHFPIIRDAAGTFVKTLLPADKARVGAFGDQVVIRPDMFTSNQADLLRELSGLGVRGTSPVWLSIDRSITALMNEPGRRVVLIFTDGHNQVPAGIHTTVEDVTRRAEYDEVMVYTIGFAVTQQPGQAGPPPQGGFGPGRGGPRRPGGRGGAPTSGNPDAPRPPNPGLKRLAADTGGGYFELTHTADLAAVFTRVADELHHQYLLAFKPQKLDEKVHSLEVRLKSRDYTVRARPSYVADPKR